MEAGAEMKTYSRCFGPFPSCSWSDKWSPLRSPDPNLLFSIQHPLFPVPFQLMRDRSEELISQQINARQVEWECQRLQQSRADRGSNCAGTPGWTISFQINPVLCYGSLGAARHRLHRKHVKAAQSSLISCCGRQRTNPSVLLTAEFTLQCPDRSAIWSWSPLRLLLQVAVISEQRLLRTKKTAITLCADSVDVWQNPPELQSLQKEESLHSSSKRAGNK